MTDAQGALRAWREASQASIPQQAVQAVYAAGCGSWRSLGKVEMRSGEEECIQILLGKREEGCRYILRR